MAFLLLFCLTIVGLLERQSETCLLWCLCISKKSTTKQMNSIRLKTMQAVKAAMVNTNFEGSGLTITGLGSLKKIRVCQTLGFPMQSVTCPAVHNRDKEKVIAQAYLTSLLVPICRTR